MKFLAVFTGTKESMAAWMQLDEKTRQDRERKGMMAWKVWSEKHAQAIKEPGAPLGKTKLVNKNGLSDTKNNLCAYVVIEAESHESAAKLFLEHPHFTIFPGDAVEILECLPIPEMLSAD